LKKLLAYSTMNHCGYAWTLASCGQLDTTVLYLVMHGIIKAKNFFCASGFISCYQTQDIRWMGRSCVYLKNESFFFILSLCQLGCFPGTIGFILKEYYLSQFFEYYINMLDLGFLIISMISSIIYVAKIYCYIIYDLYKNSKRIYLQYLLGIKTDFGERFVGQLNYILVIFGLFFFCVITYYFSEVRCNLSSCYNLDYFNDIIYKYICEMTLERFYKGVYFVFYNVYWFSILFCFFTLLHYDNIIELSYVFLYFFIANLICELPLCSIMRKYLTIV
jgi:NADH:ubiquinone oxidoreductase subunit 5 (subunit L)/multisubunit Na+/H+ antiporter MnhA subunit